MLFLNMVSLTMALAYGHVKKGFRRDEKRVVGAVHVGQAQKQTQKSKR
jgi:hypothetical protein